MKGNIFALFTASTYYFVKLPITIFFIILFCCDCFSQKVYLKIASSNPTESQTIDSIGYRKIFENTKTLNSEVHSFSEKLLKSGYLESQQTGFSKINDSTFQFQFLLHKKTNSIHIYIGNINLPDFFEEPNPTDHHYLQLPLKEVESFMSNLLKKLEKKGYSLAKIQLINFRTDNNKLFADLEINTNKQQQLNSIVVNGYEKFPKNHLHNLNRYYKNKIFNQETVQQIHSEFEKYNFIKPIKYPEILFTTDSTKVYVYLEKSKSNTFEGFIGFSNNDKDKISFNGYIDLTLSNALHGGEKFALYWKSDGNKQTTFNAGIEIPYLFKSPLGIKAQLNIFKQDSTFQNTNTNINLGYYFKYNKKLFIGYQSTESNSIKNLNNTGLSDFESNFITGSYEYNRTDTQSYLFPEKTNFTVKLGYGTRNSKTESNTQYLLSLLASHNFNINSSNIINIKTHNFLLQSDSYIINELFRFGGINSIRGFNENSLQGNFLSSILTEYRYLFSSGIYIHSILDYGYQQDKATNNSNKLLGIGFGLGVATKNGLFNIIYANGSTDNQQIQLSNSIIHISFKSIF